MLNYKTSGVLPLRASCKAQADLLTGLIAQSMEQCIRKKTEENIWKSKASFESVCKIDSDIKDLNIKIYRLPKTNLKATGPF